MAQYTIGQVVELTGVKSHILRYWEKVIPSFAPRTDMSGRRLYSQRDVDFIRRLKYLIYYKNYTIESARFQLLREMLDQNTDIDKLIQIQQIRADLCDYYFMAQKTKEKLNGQSGLKNRSEVVRKEEGR